MLATIPKELDNLAEIVSKELGLDKRVVLTHWIAENGWKVPEGYNFGNIRYNSAAAWQGVYEGVVGSPKYGDFVRYKTPEDGARAYARLMKKDPAYYGVREAISSKNPQDQLEAIIRSPWDAGHYTPDGTNQVGKKLRDVYDSVLKAIVGEDGGGGGGGGGSTPPIEDDVSEPIEEEDSTWTDHLWRPVKDNAMKAFWLVAALVLGLVGLYLLTNPLGNLTSVLAKVGERIGERESGQKAD